MNQVWWGKDAELRRGLGAELATSLGARGSIRTWPVGTPLLAQGDEEGLVAIHQGRVHLVSRRGGDRELTLARLGAGEVFGRATWLQQGVAGARAIVTEELTGWHLGREALERLLCDAPDVTRALTEAVHRLWQVAGPVGPAAGRVGRLLATWGRDHGQSGPNGILVPGILAPAEIAELVGSTREEVEHCLRTWRAEGLLSEEADHFWWRQPAVVSR